MPSNRYSMLRGDGMHISMRVQETEGLKKNEGINEGQFGEGYARTAIATWKNDASSYAALFIRGYIQWQISGKAVGDNSYGVSANQIAMAFSTRNVEDVMIDMWWRWKCDWQRTGRKAEGSEPIFHTFLGNSQRDITNALLQPYIFETFYPQNRWKKTYVILIGSIYTR